MKPLIDGHGRPIGDVRISVTDRCNFRCQYCMPAEGLPWLKRDSLLSYEEVARLVALLSSMGVHDVRLTGGEPLVRKELWRLVEMLSGIEDVHDLSLTTNGYLLKTQVADLVRAGLKRINVSLDSLAPDRFFQLTRRDSLAQVLEGLEAAESHPELRPIKVNVVALKDFTEDEVVRFADFARRTPYVVRFIEFMPLDADRSWSADKVLPNEEIRRLINEVYPLEAVGRDRHGTSRRWRFADGQGEIGFISPVSEPFCGDCNRIRLTAEGMLRTCLFSLNETDLREPMRAGASDAELEADHPRRRLAQGAQAPHRRRGLRPAGALDVAHRRVKDLPEAAALVVAAAAPLETERVPLHEAAGRVAAEEGRSAVDLPPFDRSAMDGYAVRSADTSAGPLRLVGEVAAGETATATLEPGTTLGITTGAAIPPGADAVLQSELAEVANGSVRATEPIPERAAHPRARRGRPRGRPDRARRRAADARAGQLARRRRRRRDDRPPPRAAAPHRHRLGAAAARRAARAGQDPRVQRPDGAAAGRARGRGRDRPRRDRRRLRVDPRGDRDRPGRRRARRLRRRLGRAARPRQAGLRGLRRRGGLLARAREARQAAVVRPPGLDARVRPARQPALEHRRLPRLHRAGPAAPARGVATRRCAP